MILRVKNLRNKFDARMPFATELDTFIQSYDSDDYTVNKSTVTLILPDLVPNSEA